jgi:hypothetical protein
VFSRNKGVVADGLCVISSAKESYKPSLKIRIDMSLKRRASWLSFTSLSPDFSFPGLSDSAKQTTGVLLLALISFSLSTAQAASPFTTEGKFSVGSDGSANYSIPIVVPPGTAGMQPQLALNYNSNGGNGIVGMGWGIDGLSQISRCPTTLEQDGVINGVNYTNTDRFCLDGQRLIATTDTYNTTTKQYATTSAYGANGTEYRTESANFAKIISYGQAGTGPAYFKVWTKSGQIIEYGNTADSGIEAQGKPTIRTWGVNKISDTKGNYIAVTYTEDNANGEAYVSRVDYTGNASSTPTVTPYANVQFIYETRPDSSIGYQVGSLIKSTKRLVNIKTYINSVLVKDYRLSYEALDINSGAKSRINKLTECELISCKSSVSFGYQNASPQWEYRPDIYPPMYLWSRGLDNEGSALLDLNGDGLPDMLRHLWAYNTHYSQAWLYNGNTWSTSPQWVVPNEFFIWTRDFDDEGGTIVDLNGDGLPDLAKYLWYLDGSRRGAWLNNGNGWVQATQFTPPMIITSRDNSNRPLDNEGTTFIDLNGDGLVDQARYLWISPGNIRRENWLNTGRGWVQGDARYNLPYPIWSRGLDDEGTALIDVNGDGLTDMVRSLQVGSSFYKSVWLNTGDGWVESANWQLPIPIYSRGFDNEGTTFVDINGDGLPDLVRGLWYLNDNRRQAWINNGQGWVSADQWKPPTVLFTRTDSNTPLDNEGIEFNDINGDGMPDLVRRLWVSSGNTREGSWINKSSKPNFLSSINDGLSNTSITYKSISDSGIYQKDATSGSGSTSCGFVSGTYPTLDKQSGLFVVSSHTQSDGIGGVVTTSYQYGGLKSHLRGRGSLGFRYVKESSPDSGLGVTTFYRQDFPFIGLPCQVEKRRLSDNTLLSVVQNTYANSDLATSTIISKFPYLSQSVEQAYELDGSLVSTTTTTNQYDGYGNVTSVKVDDGLGNIKTTTSTYNNNVGNWLLGRLIRSTVTSVTP